MENNILNINEKTAAYIRDIANKRLTTMVITIKTWEKVKVGYIVVGLLLFANLVSVIMKHGINVGIGLETLVISCCLGIIVLVTAKGTSNKIEIMRTNYEAFSEIVKEMDANKLLDKWIEEKYILKLKEIEETKGVETKNTCLIDFLDKVKDISNKDERAKTWERVTKTNTLRTAAEVFWIIFKPVFTMVAAGRLLYIVFVIL